MLFRFVILKIDQMSKTMQTMRALQNSFDFSHYGMSLPNRGGKAIAIVIFRLIQSYETAIDNLQ